MGALTLWKPTWFWISKWVVNNWLILENSKVVDTWWMPYMGWHQNIVLEKNMSGSGSCHCVRSILSNSAGQSSFGIPKDTQLPPVNAYMDVRKSTCMLPMLLHSEISCHRLFSRVPAIQWSLLSRWHFFGGGVFKETQNITVLVSYNKNEIMFNPWDIMISQSHCEP